MLPPHLAATQIPSKSYLLRLFEKHGHLLCTPKFDGVCALTGENNCVSRKLLPIPNDHIRHLLKAYVGHLPLHGEIVCYDSTGKMLDFNATQSAVMSKDGTPDFRFHVFDTWDVKDDYQGRIGCLHRQQHILTLVPISLVRVEWVFNYDALKEYEEKCLADGYEGVIARIPGGMYKHGRSTLKEATMLKIKPLMDEEAEIIGFEELMINTNPQVRDHTGMAKRSSHKAKLLPSNTLGAFVCKSERWGEFKVGTGLTDLQRCKYWYGRLNLVGKLLTFTYQPNHSKDKPHAARFKGFRNPEDLS